MDSSVKYSIDKWKARGNFYANTSYHFWVCSNAAQSFSEYWNARFVPYRDNVSGWNPFAIYMLSFAVNIPGELFSINNIQASINSNLAADPPDRIGVHYDLARLMKVMTIFDIVEMTEIEPANDSIQDRDRRLLQDFDYETYKKNETCTTDESPHRLKWGISDYMNEGQRETYFNVKNRISDIVLGTRGFLNATNFIFG